MGTIQEEYLIVQNIWQEKDIKKVDRFIKTKIKEKYRSLFIKCPCVINSSFTYFVNWDGSKEGWNTSDEAKEERKKFVDFILRSFEYMDIFRVIPKGEIVGEDRLQRINDKENLENFY